jgi:Bardet-Biedl syndrome 5 protein
VSNTNSAVNLSIGYDTIASLNIKKAISKLRGSTQALSCIAKFKNSRSVLAITITISSIGSSHVHTRQLTSLVLTLTPAIHRFEFIFTSLVKNSPRLFTTVQTVLKAYETSRMFRDLKVRAACIAG